jgi:hypothetical protein
MELVAEEYQLSLTSSKSICSLQLYKQIRIRLIIKYKVLIYLARTQLVSRQPFVAVAQRKDRQTCSFPVNIA